MTRSHYKVDLAAKVAQLEAYWRPGIVASLNDYKVQVVKAKGDFVWHSHGDTDDFFLVLGGRLTIQLRDGDVELGEGDLFVVPRAEPEGDGWWEPLDRLDEAGLPTLYRRAAELVLTARRAA